MEIKGKGLLSDSDSDELRRLQSEFFELERDREFCLFDQSSNSISDWSLFSHTVHRKAAFYDTLRQLVNRITGPSRISSPSKCLPFSSLVAGSLVEKKEVELIGKRNKHHLDFLSQFRLILKQAVSLVEDYIENMILKLNEDKNTTFWLASGSFDQLKSLISRRQPLGQRIQLIEQELIKIDKILGNGLPEPEKLNSRQKRSIPVIKTKKTNKSVTTKKPIQRQIETIPGDQQGTVMVDVSDMNTVSELMTKSTLCFTSIAYASENSFLAFLAGFGMIVNKNGEEVYSKSSEDMRCTQSALNPLLVREVVFCGENYFLLHEKGRLFKKAQDSSEPTLWWDKSGIKGYGWYNQIIRTSLDQPALLINLNDTLLPVIEVKADGSSGLEFYIENTTGSRIDALEPLRNNKLLTVNKEGLITLYDLDLDTFSSYQGLETFQVNLYGERNENNFYLTACQKSRYCALLIQGDGQTASRIQIYKIRPQSFREKISLVTWIDLWEGQFLYYLSICFSHYLEEKLILCGFSQQNSKAHFYELDVKTNRLVKGGSVFGGGSKELGEDRNCSKLMRRGNEVKGILSGGKLLVLKFVANEDNLNISDLNNIV